MNSHARTPDTKADVIHFSMILLTLYGTTKINCHSSDPVLKKTRLHLPPFNTLLQWLCIRKQKPITLAQAILTVFSIHTILDHIPLYFFSVRFRFCINSPSSCYAMCGSNAWWHVFGRKLTKMDSVIVSSGVYHPVRAPLIIIIIALRVELI